MIALPEEVLNKKREICFNALTQEKQQLIQLVQKQPKTPQELFEIKLFIEKIDFLRNFIGQNSPDLIEICKFMNLQWMPKNQTLFQEGEMGYNFFIIISGKVSIQIKKPDENNPNVIVNKVLVELGSGAAFGELALLFSSVRRATAMCSEDSFFMVLHQEHFQRYMKFQTNQNSALVLDFYNQLDFFKNFQLDLPQKIQIVAKTELKDYISNAAIIKQGQDANKLFFIKKGVVKVYRKILFKTNKQGELCVKHYGEPSKDDINKGYYKEIQLEIDEIYEECCFPEFEFIHQQKHMYTVITYTPCEVMFINHKDIDILTKQQYQHLLQNSKTYPPDSQLRKVYLDGQQWKNFRKNLLETIKSDSDMKRKVQGSMAIFNRDLKLCMAQPTLELDLSDDSFNKEDQHQGEEEMEKEIFKFLKKNDFEEDDEQTSFNKNKKKTRKIGSSLQNQTDEDNQQDNLLFGMDDDYQKNKNRKNIGDINEYLNNQIKEKQKNKKTVSLRQNFTQNQIYKQNMQKIQSQKGFLNQSKTPKNQQSLLPPIQNNNNNNNQGNQLLSQSSILTKQNNNNQNQIQNIQNQNQITKKQQIVQKKIQYLNSDYNPEKDMLYKFQNPIQKQNMKNQKINSKRQIQPIIRLGMANSINITDIIVKQSKRNNQVNKVKKVNSIYNNI